MKTKLFVFAVLIILPIIAYAAKGASNAEFIKYTEAVLDAIDEVESNFYSGSSKVNAELSLKKLDVALKKYERLKVKEGSREKEIMFKAHMTYLNYFRVLQIYGISTPQHDEAKETARQARALYAKYKGK